MCVMYVCVSKNKWRLLLGVTPSRRDVEKKFDKKNLAIVESVCDDCSNKLLNDGQGIQ